jgi:hypothetical protein
MELTAPKSRLDRALAGVKILTVALGILGSGGIGGACFWFYARAQKEAGWVTKEQLEQKYATKHDLDVSEVQLRTENHGEFKTLNVKVDSVKDEMRTLSGEVSKMNEFLRSTNATRSASTSGRYDY